MLRVCLLGISFGLVACTGIELQETNPRGQILSGEWLIDFGDSDAVPDLRQRKIKVQRRLPNPTQREGRRRGAEGFGLGSDLAFIVHDFQVLRADKMVIEQNKDSMGIRYEPGVYRDVSWGERERGLWEVYAGWDEYDMVIMSQANDLRVAERFELKDNRLQVLVTVYADGEESKYRRVFNRVR